MRRLFGIVVAGAMLMLPAYSFAQDAAAGQEGAAQQPAVQKFTIEGELALWSVAVRPDKTGDYEQILRRVSQVLAQSDAPEARQQRAGWRVMRGATPLGDGNIVYTHVINPVRGADYNLLQILYGTITERSEQEALYELYRGAFVQNLGLSTGRIAVDLSR